MNRFLVCIIVCFMLFALTGHAQAFSGQRGGHGGSGGHFGGHGFHGRSFAHFGPLPREGSALQQRHFFQEFSYEGFFPFSRGFNEGRFYAPLASQIGPPVVIIRDPFFCFPHGLGFTEQEAFFVHLRDFHGVAPRSTPFSLVQTGGRLIFLGF